MYFRQCLFTRACDMQPVNRVFYSLPQHSNVLRNKKDEEQNVEKLLENIRSSVIGREKVFSGPFGLRKVTYLDYIASGRALSFIEDYIRNEVLPEYGNTHTTTSITSLQTTLYRHEARDIVRNAVNASEHDSVIFVGSGSTAAVHKLIHALHLQKPPIVFVGPFEHHSNLLPWKEAGAEVVRIKQTEAGQVDYHHLEHLLKELGKQEKQMIGCFSAASNVTGILTDVDKITVSLHRHSALAFWDYATAAPYIRIDMNPVLVGDDQPYVHKDAVFISTHKFIGGTSSPGVLVAKKHLFRHSVPDGGGGGSVFFVRRDGHRYLQEPELREEGGTPAIVESIRAGLVFQLKEAVTPERIMQREDELCRVAVSFLSTCDNLVILGNCDVPRLPVFSFLVYHPVSGRFLHYNFVTALLNDMFGIQARGGCACAGPYAMDLLGLDEGTAEQIENLLVEDSRLDRTHLRRYREYSHREILRPGFTRLNLPYFLDEECLQFTLTAVQMVAAQGWKLLPQYIFNPETGEWRHKNHQVFKDRKWLGHISYRTGEMSYKKPPQTPKGPLPSNYKDCLNKASNLFSQARKFRVQLSDQTLLFDKASQIFRWFLLPSEAQACLHGNKLRCVSPTELPFLPPPLRLILSLDPVGPGDRNQDYETVFQRQQTKPSENRTPFSDGLVECLEKGFGKTNTHVSVKGEEVESEICASVESTATLEKQGTGVVVSPDQVYESCEPTEPTVCGGCESSERTEPTVCGGNESSEPTEPTVCGGNGSSERTEQTVCGGKESSELIEQTACGRDESSELTEQIACGGDDSQTPTVTNYSTSPSQNPFSGEGFVTSKSRADSDELSDISTNVAVDSAVSVSSVPPTVHRTDSDELSDTSSNVAIDSAVSVSSVPLSGHVAPQMSEAESLPETRSCCPAEELPTSDTNPPLSCKLRAGNVSSCDADVAQPMCKWFSPPKSIFKPTVKALEDFGMVQNGDRLLVCLSGGKDSLSLLHTFRQYQFYCRSKGIEFELGAVTVDPQTASYDPSPLKVYLRNLGVPYFYESQCILETAENLPDGCASICSFCSRMKRGRIYAAARRESYNVLALGQHLDDLAESFLMSFFHNGVIRTMKAHYTVSEGDLRVIRPFVYVREKDLRNFAEKNKLPVIAENCPACFEAPKERHRTKQLLASQELLFPNLYNSIMAAMKPVMSINKTGVNFAKCVGNSSECRQDIDDEM